MERDGCSRPGAAAGPLSPGSTSQATARGRSKKSPASYWVAQMVLDQQVRWDAEGRVLKGLETRPVVQSWAAEKKNSTFPGHVGALPLIQRRCCHTQRSSLDCRNGGKRLHLQAAHHHIDYKWSRALLTFALPQRAGYNIPSLPICISAFFDMHYSQVYHPLCALATQT